MKNASNVKPSQFNKRIGSLAGVNKMVREKRVADLLRFRTCCCDPRASK